MVPGIFTLSLTPSHKIGPQKIPLMKRQAPHVLSHLPRQTGLYLLRLLPKLSQLCHFLGLFQFPLWTSLSPFCGTLRIIWERP
jgi:hypothetical protein